LKPSKNSLVLLQLVLFVSSFLLLSIQSLAANERLSNFNAAHVKLGSKHNHCQTEVSQQIGEESETENETDHEDTIYISDLFSFLFTNWIKEPLAISASKSSSLLISKQSTYLEIRNFRI
jgi:hypothetical protein